MALLEERKKKLAAEGLFDEARKQLIPYLPSVIGVVTSPTGAVIRDILHRLSDRFPRHVLVWPVKVQGDGSAEEVAAAIHGFNAFEEGGRMPRPDLIIVARGGGSLEDLWSFNEEIVVRAAADSMIPLISAVGHETDITLIDFVSDRRALTPTAAAEMAVPVRLDLLSKIDSLARRQFSCWGRGLEARRTELRAAARALPGADDLLALPRQKLDSLGERLPRALKANAEIHHKEYLKCATKLSPRLLQNRTREEQERLDNLTRRVERCTQFHREKRREHLANIGGRLTTAVRANLAGHRHHIVRDRERIASLFERGRRAVTRLIERRASSLEGATGLLTALSYHGVLARGFALVRDGAGKPLRTAAQVSAGLALDIEFHDGHVAAVANGGDGMPRVARTTTPAEPAKPEASKARTRRSGGEGQGSLFG